MAEKESKVIVIDRRHFTKDGERRQVVEEEVKPPTPPVSETKKEDKKIETNEAFIELLTFIYTNALAALGKLKNGMGMSTQVNLQAAATMIEWLEAIQKKSKGNLSTEEENALKDSLYQLKMFYIEVSQEKR